MCGYTETFLIHLKLGTAMPRVPLKEGSLENLLGSNFVELLAKMTVVLWLVIVGLVIK